MSHALFCVMADFVKHIELLQLLMSAGHILETGRDDVEGVTMETEAEAEEKETPGGFCNLGNVTTLTCHLISPAVCMLLSI